MLKVVWRATCGLAGALVVAACRVHPRGPALPSEAALVRAARAAYQAAWQAGDTAGLARTWAPGFHLTQQHGVHYGAAELLRQSAAFGPPQPRLSWRPRTVHVYAPRRLAMEAGEFTYTHAGRGPGLDGTVVRGTYAAQWRRTSQGWRLGAEIQTPTACTGAAALCAGL